jgi:hypothetical protein
MIHPTRYWHKYFSPECRKKKWNADPPSDIRATLNRIEAKLDQILKGRES